MFFFGHIGITLGVFYSLRRLSSKNNFWAAVPYIIVGSLLPDIIDKPLGRIIFAEDDRKWAHLFPYSIVRNFIRFGGLLSLSPGTA